MARRKNDNGSDVRGFSGPPSIRERLWRQYNEANENDAPINPTLDELLFGPGESEEAYYDLPLLKKANKGAAGRIPDEGGAEAVPFGPVDSMPPTKHGSESGRMMGGYDGGFESGLMGDWDKNKFFRLVENFDANRKPGENSIIIVGEKEFELKPHGGGDGVHYRYIIEGGGWKIYIHHAPECGIQPVRFRLGFEALCGRSLFDVHAEVLSWLGKIGFSVHRNQEIISRVDVQVMVERPVSDFVRPVAHEHVVKRAKQGEVYLYGNTPTSYSFGCNIRHRAYDKKRELLETCNELGLQMIARYCCGGIIPDHLTRLEFQVRRDALNIMQINTIDDLRDCENDLVSWLTFDWFRILDGPRKKGHTKEQNMADVWLEVREAFNKYFPGGDNNRTITRKTSDIDGLKCTADDLAKQAFGCFASAIARSKNGIRDLQAVLSYIKERLDEYGDDILKKIVDRSKRLAVLTGYAPPETDKSLDPRYALDDLIIELHRKAVLE